MPYVSEAEDLALHGARVLGFARASRIAGRYGLDPGIVQELLLDHEARGWARQMSFAGSSGWSLTDAGRSENERRLAAELSQAGGRDTVADAHRRLCAPLSGRLARFDGYAGLYSSALGRAQTGQRSWVDAPDRDSCHIVWIQFHEDLLATLGIPRSSDN